jgi:hypothetical protein
MLLHWMKGECERRLCHRTALEPEAAKRVRDASGSRAYVAVKLRELERVTVQELNQIRWRAKAKMTDGRNGGIVIFMPGPWASHSDAIRAIAGANMGRAIAGGSILADIKGKRHAEFFTAQADPNLAVSMQKLSANAFDDATLAQIAAHKSLVYLTIDPAHEGLAERLAFFTHVVRSAGGLGVALRRTGLAHPWQRWDELLGRGDPQSLYRALVVHVPWDDEVTSFGMSQFGLPDTSVPKHLGDDSLWTLGIFNLYQWTEAPDLRSGHTFGKDAQSPRMRLDHVADTRYPPSNPTRNPHGLWRLTPA